MNEKQTGVSGPEVRDATFPQAMRGYDREAVHSFLDRIADAFEGGTAGIREAAPAAVKNELAKVGQRTAGILTAAEDAAANLRDEAREYAERLRASADDEARKARFAASQKADELVSAAEAKAEAIIEEAIARRRNLNQAISSLLERRDDIAVEAQRLADELLEAVDVLRSDEPGEAEDHPADDDVIEEDFPPDDDETEMLTTDAEEDVRR